MLLPENRTLPIKILSSCFDNVTNSYKFYWFLSILDFLKEKDQLNIPIKDLSLRMISLVWFPLDFFHLSFGKQDSFKQVSKLLSSKIVFDHSTNSLPLIEQINSKLNKKNRTDFENKVFKLVKYVPYRFLRPFFSNEIKGLYDPEVDKKIKELANKHITDYKIFYSFESNNIVIHPQWAKYFSLHQKILRDFIRWNLILFVQKHNSYVTGLSEKLEKPMERDLKLAKDYWISYLKNNDCKCIYSNDFINVSNFSIDHFLPWSYVAHDLLWNLIPTTRSVNSSKNFYLPSFEHYFRKHVKLQFDSFIYHFDKGNHKQLEDYSIFFGDKLNSIREYTFELFIDYMKKYYNPLFQTASNMGFQGNWIFKK